MESFTKARGIAVPMLRINIDTDQITPGRELIRVHREGYAASLFSNLRYTGDRTPNPDFILNRAPWSRGTILLADRNFGCGSSRESAPRALREYGFRAVIAEGYAEIFFGNSITLGIPCVTATREDIAKIAVAVEADPTLEVTIDVTKQEVRFGGQTVKGAIRESARDALINGRWDAIGELIDGLLAAKTTAAKLPYLAA